MPPSIPTYRPLVTPLRGATLIAAIAVVCSVFLAVDSAYGRLSTAAFAPEAGFACNEGGRDPREFANRADDQPLSVQ